MASLWNRIPTWVDWVVALVLGIVVLNLNVTSSGDPLSGLGQSGGVTSAGITEPARVMFYGSLVVGGAVLAAAGFVVAALRNDDRVIGGLLARTFSGVSLAGVLGLLLDYRDGPVRTVQLAVYVMLALAIVRMARLATLTGVGATPDPENSLGE